MAVTPDMFYNGESVCSMCDKPMFANDHGITYDPMNPKHGYKMFCPECAVKLVMSVGQDLMRLQPEVAFGFYREFKHPGAPGANMRRHAEALRKLCDRLDDWADAMSDYRSK
jgi:hypothetical protein